MSRKNRTMTEKERKVKKYDAIAFKRMYGDYCAADYIEGRREYTQPKECDDSPTQLVGVIVWLRDGNRRVFSSRLQAYKTLKSDGFRMLDTDGSYWVYMCTIDNVVYDRVTQVPKDMALQSVYVPCRSIKGR